MAEKINIGAKEPLYKAAEKINGAIDEVNNMQSQIDNLVVEGDSSVEAAQARVDLSGNVYPTLKDRLDNEHEELLTQVSERVTNTDFSSRNELVDQQLSMNDNRINDIDEKLNGITVNELEEPLYFAHRGAKNIFPESSQEAYRGCVDMGLVIIEMDVRQTADGVLVVNHDDTMERTTNKTGSVASFSAMGFKSAKIDLLFGWEGTTVLFEDLLREFGNKVIYVPEIKDYSDDTSQKVTDTILKYHLQDNVIIQSFSAPNLTYPLSKGLQVCYLKNQEDVTPASIKDWGFQSVGLSANTISDQYITDCINLGLKVYMYTINRRYEHDYYLDLGVHGFFSDDPLWIQRKSPILEWDSFRDQVFTHGMFSPPVDSGGILGGNRGMFKDNTKFGWPTESTKRDFCLQGWVGELPDTFTVEFKINYEDVVSSVRWGSIAFCTPNDYYDDQSESGTKSNGYHLLLRESGSLDFYIRQNGVSSQLNSIATTAITEGQTAQLKVEVTASQIIITRVDTDHSMTVSNSTFRGGYLHFGRNLAGVTFENVHVIR